MACWSCPDKWSVQSAQKTVNGIDINSEKKEEKQVQLSLRVLWFTFESAITILYYSLAGATLWFYIGDDDANRWTRLIRFRWVNHWFLCFVAAGEFQFNFVVYIQWYCAAMCDSPGRNIVAMSFECSANFTGKQKSGENYLATATRNEKCLWWTHSWFTIAKDPAQSIRTH